MKNYYLILLCFCFFISCKSNRKIPAEDSLKNRLVTKSQADSLIKIFKPMIQGIWVDNGYITALIKTRSPYKATKSEGVNLIDIDIADDIKDSIRVGESNGHEPDNFIIYLKNGQKPSSLKTSLKDDKPGDFYEIGYDIGKKDTNLLIYRYNKDSQLLNISKYTKVLNTNDNPDNDAGYGISYITNKILITGKYSMIDSAGTISKIEFTNNGKVSGFPGFKNFYINTDFAAGPENNMDDIVFDFNTKTAFRYIFNFKEDTLYFYSEGANANSTELISGKLKYKLVRQK